MARWLAVLLFAVLAWQLATAQQPPRPAPLDPVLDLTITRVMVLENRVSMLTARLAALETKTAPAKK